MDDPTSHLPDHDLKGQREEVRRGLLRVNSAGAVILLVVIGLAIAAIVTAVRANKNFAEAQAATSRAQEQLWNSSLSQANAGRLSGLPGVKKRGLAAISAAAQIRPGVELRNEAIAHFALTDLEDAVALYRVAPFTNPATDPAGERMGAIGPPDVLHIYDVKTGAELSRTHWKNLRLKCLVFSPDNRVLLLSPVDGKLIAVESPSGKLLWQLPSWRIASFTPDSRFLAVTFPKESQVRFFDTLTGVEQSERIKLDEKAVDYEFDPTGEKLVVSLGKSLQIVERKTGKVLKTLEHNAKIRTMDWSGDIIAVGDSESMVRVWNLRSGEIFSLRGHKSVVSRLSLNRRGNILMSCSYDGTTKLWNPLTGWQILTTTEGIGLGFSTDDSRIVYCTQDGFGAWAIERPIGFRELSVGTAAYKAAHHTDFSRDGNFLAVSHDEGIRIVHLPSERVLWFQPMVRGRSAYFLPDGKRLITCGDLRVSIWPVELDAENGNAKVGTAKHIKLPSQQHVDQMTLNGQRTKGALPISDSDCVIFEIDNPANMVVLGPTSNPKNPSISPDGRWVATGTFHGSGSRLWDASTGKRLRNIDSGNAGTCFSPDGRLLLIGSDREFRFYDTEKWEVVHRVPTHLPNDLPTGGVFSPDGKAVGISKYRSQVELLSTEGFVPIASLVAPETQLIHWMSFNADATKLALGCENNTVQIWDLAVLRQHLGQLGLDWGGNLATVLPRRTPLGEQINPMQPLFTFLVGTGVALVIICSLYVLRRQRQLIASYLSIDGLIERRNRELNTAKAEIMHSQKMKALGTLAAGIAHDFNNLLSVIRMASKLIGRETQEQPAVSENIAEIEQAVLQGKNIVRSMLGYSRDADEGPAPVSLPDLVEDTVGLLTKEFLSGITLSLKLDQDLPLVHVSRSHIEQILLNLVVNASEAMKGKGSLRIIVRRRQREEISYVLRPKGADNHVELIISDTGPGISEKIISRIFEPFFTTKTVGAQRGTGLGLSMVYTIAEQNGFGIAVRSPEEGGVEFRLSIPVEAQRDEKPASPPFGEDNSIEHGTVRQSHMVAIPGER